MHDVDWCCTCQRAHYRVGHSYILTAKRVQGYAVDEIVASPVARGEGIVSRQGMGSITRGEMNCAGIPGGNIVEWVECRHRDCKRLGARHVRRCAGEQVIGGRGRHVHINAALKASIRHSDALLPRAAKRCAEVMGAMVNARIERIAPRQSRYRITAGKLHGASIAGDRVLKGVLRGDRKVVSGSRNGCGRTTDDKSAGWSGHNYKIQGGLKRICCVVERNGLRA